nr:GNAT family N-acetyltransferase [Pseudomonas azotoformans]
MRIRPAEPVDATSIATIYNQGIAERSSTFETTPRNPDDMLERLEAHDRYPVLVMLDEHDKVIGWASLSDYRNRACYDGIADFSIYMSREVRGQGLGKNLLQALLKEQKLVDFGKSFLACSHLTAPVSPCAKLADSAKSGFTRNMHALTVVGSTAQLSSDSFLRIKCRG